ncbi:hypothetical protein VP01_2925g1 [Puccinia sorghi]|uniref:Uncharacterized protein n=1 Tax=Puccinia sorghi TaxID=27349 RepID=A0A0L6V1A8_9BASI|nr:hypothetical protein VP01_2925g1 [Puccinia sorghi]
MITLALQGKHRQIKSEFHKQKITSLQKIHSIFSLRHGNISNFSLQKSQCHQSQRKRTGNPRKNKIAHTGENQQDQDFSQKQKDPSEPEVHHDLIPFLNPHSLRNFPPVIEKILDVEANIHCGFRVILVAQRMNVEGLGPCDIDHWMRISTTGHLMAQVFNRPVFDNGKSWIQTFFKLKTFWNNNLKILIGLIESQHFVVLKMKDENLFPAAQATQRQCSGKRGILGVLS